MAEVSEDRPNLKICIENTDEESEAEVITDIKGDSDISEEAISEDEAPDLAERSEQSDAESEEALQVSVDEFKFSEPKRYENKAGNFITGFDPTSKESLEKKEQRAKRFGISAENNTVGEAELNKLYESLGLSADDLLEHNERGIRLNTINLRGLDHMSTQDVFKYFQDFSPGSIEWIDDTSCNVVWLDPVTTARALLTLSRVAPTENSTDETTARSQNMDVDNGESTTKKKNADDEKAEPDNGETPMEEFDDDLNLLSDDEGKKENSKDDSGSDKEKSKETKPEEDIGVDDSDEKKLPSLPSAVELPPGRWRLGVPYLQKADTLVMRYATKDDKKQAGAEKKSQYYREHGNPNYGGMKGLISGSRKRRLRATQREREERVARLEMRRAARHRIIPGETEFDRLLREAQEEQSRRRRMQGLFDGSSSEDVAPPRGAASALPLSDDDYVDEEVEEAEQEESASEPEVDDDLDLEHDEELQRLLAPDPEPARKRSRRMYADDVNEDETSAKRRLGPLPPAAARGAVVDARDRILHRRQDGRGFKSSSAGRSGDSDGEADNSPSGLSSRLGSRLGTRAGPRSQPVKAGGDLRSRLGVRRPRDHGDGSRGRSRDDVSHLPRLRIEVQPD